MNQPHLNSIMRSAAALSGGQSDGGWWSVVGVRGSQRYGSSSMCAHRNKHQWRARACLSGSAGKRGLWLGSRLVACHGMWWFGVSQHFKCRSKACTTEGPNVAVAVHLHAFVTICACTCTLFVAGFPGWQLPACRPHGCSCTVCGQAHLLLTLHRMVSQTTPAPAASRRL